MLRLIDHGLDVHDRRAILGVLGGSAFGWSTPWKVRDDVIQQREVTITGLDAIGAIW